MFLLPSAFIRLLFAITTMKSPLIRLILINLGVTAGLLFGLNILAYTILVLAEQGARILEATGQSEDIKENRAKASLPNYENRFDEMFQHFQETDEIEVFYEPYIGWSREAFEGETITIDEQGHRLHSPLPNAVPDTPKVHIFGGSTVWGTGVVDDETLPAFYQQAANIPTINQGETAFVSRQSLIAFSDLLASGDPVDGVIFYDGVNDVQYGCRRELDVNQHSRTQVFRDRIGSGRSTPSPTRDFGRFWQTLFIGGIQDLVVEVQDIIADNRDSEIADKALVCDDDDERAQQVAEALVANWELAHDLATARGVEFLAVLQPVSFLGNTRLDHIQPELSTELWAQYKAVYPKVQQILAERNYDWVVDYVSVLSGEDTYYYVDFCHVSANGNAEIAEQLYDDTRRRWAFLGNAPTSASHSPNGADVGS